MAVDIMTLFSQTTAPIIFVSAIGLITLTLQNRYGRIKDSIYAYQKQKLLYLQKDEESKAKIAQCMLKKYQSEAILIKDAMLSAFTSVLLISLTSLLILLQGMVGWKLYYITVISFSLAIFALVIAMVLIIIAMAQSIRTLSYEIDHDDDGVRFGL